MLVRRIHAACLPVSMKHIAEARITEGGKDVSGGIRDKSKVPSRFVSPFFFTCFNSVGVSTKRARHQGATTEKGCRMSGTTVCRVFGMDFATVAFASVVCGFC